MTAVEKYTLLISAISVAIAAWSMVAVLIGQARSARHAHASVESQFFAEYTRRYQEIMAVLPQNIILDRAPLGDVEEGDRERVVGLLRAYIDLCAEEYFLWRTGRLRPDVWEYWWDGIKDNFKIRSLRQVWEEVTGQRDYGDLKVFLQKNGVI